MALLSPAFANGVTQGFVTAEDVVKLFDNGVAIEVEVPEGAATYTLYYGPNGYDNGLSSRLNQHPSGPANQLRILAFLPDPATVNPCAAEEAQARIVIIPKEIGRASCRERGDGRDGEGEREEKGTRREKQERM